MQVGEPVRGHGEVVGGGQPRDAAPFGDAAAHPGVRLQDGGGAPVDELQEVPPRRVDLAGGHRGRHRRRDLRVPVDVVGHQRLLDPAGVPALPRAHGPDGRGRVAPRVVGVEEQLDAGADGLAGRRNARRVVLGRHAADLDLDGREAHVRIAAHFGGQVVGGLAGGVVAAAGVGRRHPRAVAAQMTVQGQVRLARHGVPQRLVDGADGPHHRAAPPLQQGLAVHRLPDRLDVVGVAPHHEAAQQFAHGQRGQPAAPGAAVTEADALGPCVGPQPDQGVVALGHGPGGERDAPVERHDAGGRLDGGDLHGVTSLWLALQGRTRAVRRGGSSPLGTEGWPRRRRQCAGVGQPQAMFRRCRSRQAPPESGNSR